MAIVVDDTVLALSGQSVTRVRTAAGLYSATSGSKGVYAPGSSTSTTINACIGPINDRTRQTLPEGIRLTARFLMHTLADVRGDLPTASGTSIYQADRITYNGRTYQVYQDRDWVGHGQYGRYILVEETAQP